MPPVAGTGRGAAGAHHALVEPVQLLSVGDAHVVLLGVGRLGMLSFEIGLDGLVLRVEVREVNNQVLENEHVPQRGDDSRLAEIGVDGPDAGQRVEPVTVHGAGAADAFSAGPSQRESGVQVVFDVEQRVQVHRGDLLEVHVVADVSWLFAFVVGVVSVDEELLHL